MKKITSIIFSIFMGLALAIGGGVLLSSDTSKDFQSLQEENSENIESSAVIPTRSSFSINLNGGTICKPRSYQIGDTKLTNYGYGFSVNSNGYFESQNKGVANSYSMIKIEFSANSLISNTFSIRYISYGESYYDYAIFSNLDQTLSEGYSVDSTYYKSTYGEASPEEKTITYYDISKGTHYIYVKFRKDGSNNYNYDSLQLFFETDLLAMSVSSNSKFQFEGLMYGTLPTATRSGYEFDGWWTSSTGGESITENSIYNGQAIYAHWKPLKVTFNSNGGIITNMNMWKKYYNQSCVSISYNDTTKMNAVTVNGVGGWEIIGCPIYVDKNTSYSFTFDFSVGEFSTSDGHPGVYVQVVTDVPNGYLQDLSLVNVLIEKNTSGTKTVTFNSGGNSTVYLVFNAGYFQDGATYTINIGNFCRDIGNMFNMIGELEVSNSTNSNSNIGSNSVEKNGYNFNGWRTSGYLNQGYPIYNSSGNYVYLSDNDYLNNLNNWTKNFYPSAMSTSYTSSTKMSTFTVNGVGGWEILSRTISVSTNTTYTLSFDYKAGEFYAPNADMGQRLNGLAFMVVHNLGGGTGGTNGDLQAYALETSVIYSGSSGRKTITFNSGSYTTLYLVLNAGYLNDGTSYSIEIGNFYLTGNSISQVTNSFWNSNGTWKYYSGVTAWAQYSIKTYTVALYTSTGIGSVSGGGIYNYGSSVSISASVGSGYTFARWSDGNTSKTRTISNLQSSLSLIAYATPNTYTITYNANGGTTPLNSTNIAYKDFYGKKNIYDATKCDISGPLSRSGDIFTLSCNNTTSGWQWGNFNQIFSNVYRPNTKYTVVYECLSFSGAAFNVTLTSPGDEGPNGKTDISNTGHCEAHITGVGVYTSSFTTKSSFNQSNLYYDLRSYADVASGDSVYATFRVSVFVGDILFNNFSYASFGTMPTTNIMPTPTRQFYTFNGWWTSANGGTQVTSSTTYSTVGNQTLYAHWTPVAIEVKVHLRLINLNGSYSSSDNESGGYVKLQWYLPIIDSNGNSMFTESEQKNLMTGWNAHQGQQFKIIAHAYSGYAFVGFSTSATPSEAIRNPSSPLSTTATYYPTTNTDYYVYFKQVSDNQLRYDETDKYFYFEDGYYPQSDAGYMKIEKNCLNGETINGVTVVYDKDEGVVTLNGTKGDGLLVPFVVRANNIRFKSGAKVRIEYLYISGSLTYNESVGGGASVAAETHNGSSPLASRNYCDNDITFANKSFSMELILNSSAEISGNRIIFDFWTEKAGSVVFNSLKFKVKITYDVSSILDSSATATGDSINISQTFPTDMREWVDYEHGDRFSFNSFNPSTKMNTFNVIGDGGWEIIGYPVKVTQNTNYVLTFDYQQNGFDALGSGYGGLPVMVTSSVVDDDCLDRSLSYYLIYPSSSSEIKTATINFNSGTNTTLYIILNAGWLADGQIHNIKIGNFKLSGGTYSADKEFPVYLYNGDKYVKVAARGQTKWFKFEPIRWRISDYGVEKTELNIARYKTLLKFKDYTSFSDNFVAVSDLILGVGAMNNTLDVREGDSVADMTGFQNIENMTNSLSNDTLKTIYNRTGNVINVDSYSGYGNGQTNAVNKQNTIAYSSPFRICSVAELDEVGFVNKQARASDMVAFILGLEADQVSYWTRDLSNLGSGVAITPTGTQVRPWLDQMLGMRFAYTFKEGSAGGGRLDYESLNYIQSTGTQYIDTGWATTTGMICEYVADWQAPGYVIGSHDATEPYGRNGGWLSDELKWQLAYGGSCPNSTSANLNQKYKVKFSTVAGDVYLDVDDNRVDTYVGETQATATSNVMIFTNGWGLVHVASDTYTKAKFYGAKIWSSYGVLVFDFEPVRNIYTGEIGLWDKVSQRFYGNAGAGNFIAG